MSGQAPTAIEFDGYVIESGSTLDRGAPLDPATLKAEVSGYLSEGGLAEKVPELEVDPALVPAEDKPGSEPARPSESERQEDMRTARETADRIARGEDPEAPPAKVDPKKLRVDELQGQVSHYTREKHRLISEAQIEQERLNQLRADRQAEEQLAAQRRTGKADPAAAAAAALPAADDDPMPDWGKYDDEGKTFTEYQKDQLAWISRDVDRRTAAAVAKAVEGLDTRVDKRTAEQREAEETDRVERAIDDRHRGNLDKLHKDHPDFKDLIAGDEFRKMPRTAFMTTLIKLHDKGPDVLLALAQDPALGYSFADLDRDGHISPAMYEAFRECDDPVRLVTALANNRGEAQRIANLGHGAALRAMYALETQGDGAKTATPSGPGSKTATPPLPGRVGGARSVAGPKPLDQLSTDSEDDVASWVERMNREEGIASS